MERKIAPGIISLIILLLLLGVYLFYSLPSHAPHESSGNYATLIISRDFGTDILGVWNVTPGISVMDALLSVANVSTAYGGKFVVAINNISSDPRNQVDWFYYVNGILANVGACDYVIRPGDTIRWDYHAWKKLMVNAEVEDFPNMFLQGYQNKSYPVVIAYEEKFQDDANLLGKFLEESVTKMNIIPLENLSKEMLKKDNVIILGNSSTLVKDINEKYMQLGWKYHMERGCMLDDEGRKYRGAFAEITQSPYNPKGIGACENLLLLISGEEPYVHEVVIKLINGEISSFWLMVGDPL